MAANSGSNAPPPQRERTAPHGSANAGGWRAHLLRLQDPNGLPPRDGVKTLRALREDLEVLPPASQADFVAQFIPTAMALLEGNPPCAIGADPAATDCAAPSREEGLHVHELRSALVAILRILPSYGAELIRPLIPTLMPLALKIMTEDADDNATEAMQFFTDMNKAFRSAIESYIPQFLDFILHVASSFDRIATSRLTSSGAAAEDEGGFLSAGSSFKLLHDAPVMIVLVFQLHRKFINEYIPRFVPVIIALLRVDVSPPLGGNRRSTQQGAAAPSGHSPQIENACRVSRMSPFGEYISAQIKALSFMAYIARGFAPTLREYRTEIPEIVTRLLRSCPLECAPARKELLVAIRHILSTELRTAFLPHLETLMDRQLLLGDGYTAFYVFRPAAYSMLADLIHHVRLELAPSILGKVILMYSQVLHDPTLPNGIQTMSIKLLLNLVDTIVSDRFEPLARRPFLMRIFATLLYKFKWLQGTVAELIQRRKAGAAVSLSLAKEESSCAAGLCSSSEPPTVPKEASGQFDEKSFDIYFNDPLHSRAIATDNVAFDSSRDNVRDLKFQLKTLISGVKNIILALKTVPFVSEEDLGRIPSGQQGGGDSHNVKGHEQHQGSAGGGPAAPAGLAAASITPTSQSPFTMDEAELYLAPLLRDGLGCFDIFVLGKPLAEPVKNDHGDGSVSARQAAYASASASAPPGGGAIPADEKDLMDQFGYIFTLLDSPIFHDVIGANMNFLVDRIKENVALVSLPQYFLAISGISRGFAAILAKNLMDRFEEIGSSNPLEGAIILRLFKLLFLAVSVYPEENESVLQPYLSEIILNCFKFYPRSDKAINYFLLLRSLFRSIGGGRFDALYKEVLPLLQTILDELANLPPSTSDQNLCDMYVELCLTTPVRLSNLLPYLSYLMRPVLLAMQSGTDLVNQGLRTFELCIDNLTPDFLEPILAPVFPEILACLWGMLKPPPANQLHSHTAVRLLGKLGGKARRFLTTPSPTLTPASSAFGAHQVTPNSTSPTGSGLEVVCSFQLSPTPGGTSATGATSPSQSLAKAAFVRDIHIPCDPVVKIAMRILSRDSPTELYPRAQALLFVRRTIAMILGKFGFNVTLEGMPERLVELNQGCGSSLFPFSAMPAKDHVEVVEELELSKARTRSHGLAVHSLSLSEKSYSTVGATRALLGELICSLFDACRHDDMREEIASFLETFYQLVLIVFLFQKEQHTVVECIDFDLVCDVLIEYMTVQNEKQSSVAVKILRSLYQQYTICIPDKDTQYALKVFFFAADKAIGACFRKNIWQRISACRVINNICDMGLSTRFYWHHEIRLLRGILFVIKSLPAGSSGRYSEELSEIVYKIIRLSNTVDKSISGDERKQEYASQRRQYFDQVMLALVTELSNPNSSVRDTVKAAFQILSELQECELTSLLLPLKTRVYGPIFSKPLRALPLHVQMGYIDAITYCMSLKPALLEVNDELIRLINEALALIESDDNALIARSANGTASLLSLRVVCIKLLSACLASHEFQQQVHMHPLRNQIVSVFFKTLYARQSELVEVSRTALEQVMSQQQHKLPTDLLQNGLRPVLQSLGEPRHLNLVAVGGLRRILQLFSHFFKAEIGRKLLDYLRVWANQQVNGSLYDPSLPNGTGKMAPSANGSARQLHPDSMEIKIVTAIMELFCLLPSCGQMFMGDLFRVVLQLEVGLQRSTSSPFRAVLLSFVELYPADGISFFIDNISNSRITALFASLMTSQNPSLKVISEISRIFEPLFRAFFSKDPAITTEMRASYLLIVLCFYQYGGQISESILVAHADFITRLWNYLEDYAITMRRLASQNAIGASRKMGGEDDNAHPGGLASSRYSIDGGTPTATESRLALLVGRITMAFTLNNPSCVSCAFHLLNMYAYPYVFDCSTIPAFYRIYLEKNIDSGSIEQIVATWRDLLGNGDVDPLIKAKGTRFVILPLVSQLRSRRQEQQGSTNSSHNYDSIFSMIEDTLWNLPIDRMDSSAKYSTIGIPLSSSSCIMAIEELQLTVALSSILLESRPPRARQVIPKIVSFLTMHAQSVDCSVRYSSIYALGQILSQDDENEARGANALSIFQSLLNSPTADIRAILKQTFNLFIPYLMRQKSLHVRQETVRSISHCLTRDGFSMTLVVTLWQGIAHNRDAFEAVSADLVKPLVYSFSRCSLMAFASADSRKIPLNVAECILGWHLDLAKSSRSPLITQPYLADLVINGLVRLLYSIPDYAVDAAFFNRGLSLLDAFLRDFPSSDYGIRMASIERLLGAGCDYADESTTPMVKCGIRLLTRIIAGRDVSVMAVDMAYYEKWIRAIIDRATTAMIDNVIDLFSVIFEKFSLNARLSENAIAFLDYIFNTLIDMMNGGRHLHVAFAIIRADRKDVLLSLPPSCDCDAFFSAFARSLYRAVSDPLGASLEGPQGHGNPTIAAIPGGAAGLPLNPSSGASKSNFSPAEPFAGQIVIPGIEYSIAHMMHTDFTRAPFLAAIRHLWEHCTDPMMMQIVLRHVLLWIQSSDEVPNVREKVDILLVPCKVFEIADAKCTELFLLIIYEIYSAPAYASTELRSRLEGSFLLGLKCESIAIRNKFSDLLNASIPRNIMSRLRHIFETQRWELIGSHYWIPIAIDLLLKVGKDFHSIAIPLASLNIQIPESTSRGHPIFGTLKMHMDTIKSAAVCTTHDCIGLITYLASLDSEMCHMLWVSLLPIFWRAVGQHIGSDAHAFLTTKYVKMLSNDAYLSQARMRPNVIKSMVEAISESRPLPEIPPFLIAYVMKTYSSWYEGCAYLEEKFEESTPNVDLARVATRDQPWMELVHTMGTMYREVGENDYMFGSYRRGFLLKESNITLSFDQMDMWSQSQKLTEAAMTKCRTGVLPFSEVEFAVWEERWISSAKRLQQWDLLTDISRSDMDAELGLECLWRLADWSVPETHQAAGNLLKSCGNPTSRLKFLESFLVISQNRDQPDRFSAFQTSVEEAIQLALHEWQALPSHPGPAHGTLLHTFQMLVEVQESVSLYSNLGNGNSQNLTRPQFLADLKSLLTAWRERLPNNWDDMNYWSDILAWRQHVFTTINSAFQPFIADPSVPSAPPGSNGTHTGISNAHSSASASAAMGSSSNAPGTASSSNQQTTQASGGGGSHPFAFRGYHEMAWLINRFAHIARKNHLTDVCLSFLNRIYTLPNIEIQDAFLKLREQAKCYMDSPGELPTALEVVNATNLNYFSGLQKGEFFVLRSIILSKLGMVDEANRVFAQAVQIDLNIGHGWAAWGRFNDHRFSQHQDMNFALNAVNCYLQAATLFKAHKSRKFLARILWLLTFEDSTGSLGKSFEMYNHELPTWFWVSFVPQLLSSLSRKEQRQARFVLIKIAKNYPQALYLPLRTFHEDCRIQYGARSAASIPQSGIASASSASGAASASGIINNPLPGQPIQSGGMGSKDPHSHPGSANSTIAPTQQSSNVSQADGLLNGAGTEDGGASAAPQSSTNSSTPFEGGSAATAANVRKHPLESADDLLSILKTGYPLLALTMENAMEHIVHRLRSTVDEDFYRVLTSLIGEAFQYIMNKISGHGNVANASSTNLIEASLRRVYSMICNSASLSPLYKESFERDFMQDMSEMRNANESPHNREGDADRVLTKLFLWRNKLEPNLQKHPRKLILDGLSRFLAEFEYHRYDDIDVPGQYLLMKDGNQDFVKIDKFEAVVPVVRRHGTSYRRLVVRGSDGELYPFAVQNPAGRQTRREERILQLLRLLDVAIKRNIDCRRRNLYFNVPAVVSISAHVRLVADDPTQVTFEEILDEYCAENGISSEEVFLYFKEQVLARMPPPPAPSTTGDGPKMNLDLLNLRTDLFADIVANVVPENILRRYMDHLTSCTSDRWIYRRDFIRQFGVTLFQNYVFSIGHRFLHKCGFSRRTTASIQTDILPMVTASGQISLIEIVPFRLTPNIQEYITPIGVDGVLVSTIVSAARSLTKENSDLNEYLSIFVRDELLLWYLNYCSIQQQALPNASLGEMQSRQGPVIGEVVENPFEKLEAAGIDERAFFGRVQQNCELIMKRAQTMSCIKEEEQIQQQPQAGDDHLANAQSPLFQTVLDLISSATNPQKLAQMDGHWHPWF